MKALKWTCLCVLLTFAVYEHRAGPSATFGAKGKKSRSGVRKSQKMVISPADLAALQTVSTKRAHRDERISTFTFGRNKDIYTVWHVEFWTAADCARFNVEGAHVLTKVK